MLLSFNFSFLQSLINSSQLPVSNIRLNSGIADNSLLKLPFGLPSFIGDSISERSSVESIVSLNVRRRCIMNL